MLRFYCNPLEIRADDLSVKGYDVYKNDVANVITRISRIIIRIIFQLILWSWQNNLFIYNCIFKKKIIKWERMPY